jgi:hypothetical protein
MRRPEERALRARIRLWLAVFVSGLLLSGATALPLEWETRLLVRLAGPGTRAGLLWPELASWLTRVSDGVAEAGRRFPFLAYGTDWLAFGDFAIALAFVGPWRDPVRNAWVVDFGLIACGLAVPFALVAGAARGIPVFWRLIDCGFGVIGCVPLLVCRRLIQRLEMRAMTSHGRAALSSAPWTTTTSTRSSSASSSPSGTCGSRLDR